MEQKQISIDCKTGKQTIEYIDIVDEPTHEPSPEELRQIYEQDVANRIRQRYSIDEEFSILRQRDSKIEEFDEYNAYCELCKQEARIALNMVE